MPESPYTADLPAHLGLEPGATARLPLSGPLRSGYTWSAAVEGEAVTAAVTLERDPAAEPSSPASFATQRLELDAVRPGTALVTLKLARSWQPDTPLATHAVQVSVRGPAGH